jgi:hypothetical protein
MQVEELRTAAAAQAGKRADVARSVAALVAAHDAQAAAEAAEKLRAADARDAAAQEAEGLPVRQTELEGACLIRPLHAIRLPTLCMHPRRASCVLVCVVRREHMHGNRGANA